MMLSKKAKELLENIVCKSRRRRRDINQVVVRESFELEKNGDKETRSILEELEKKQYVTITEAFGEKTDTWTIIPTEKAIRRYIKTNKILNIHI